ncbi:Protein zgrf1 [Linderina macrospora]|uniref:Protein zgrf1 n=1 Tax=Linderina macrospora TaxID=4868 RepID=A0ACC1IZW2_9FUNG|nr:Protein zgrf1 [Linderina macrospora]
MRKFTALYTHQKQKKVKAWQEGTAHYNEEHNEFVLYDVDNKRISSYRLRAREPIELSNEYDIGRYLLTLEEEKGGGCDDDTAGSNEEAQQENTIRTLPTKTEDEENTAYMVLYTTQKVKKVKAWAEGTLMYNPDSSRIVLKDDSGSTLTSSHYPKSKAIEIGSEIDHGQYLIQIESLKGDNAPASAENICAT